MCTTDDWILADPTANRSGSATSTRQSRRSPCRRANARGQPRTAAGMTATRTVRNTSVVEPARGRIRPTAEVAPEPTMERTTPHPAETSAVAAKKTDRPHSRSVLKQMQTNEQNRTPISETDHRTEPDHSPRQPLISGSAMWISADRRNGGNASQIRATVLRRYLVIGSATLIRLAGRAQPISASIRVSEVRWTEVFSRVGDRFPLFSRRPRMPPAGCRGTMTEH